ncbi:MAG TPA: hypothetical protein VHY22_16650 [Chthoniobacteraceae bacterium]|jgi:hypothetical protein|nr:hypothetical protein [Chthoniobacteraceae bacterium]
MLGWKIAIPHDGGKAMDHTTFLIIHLLGVAALSIGIGGMLAGGSERKLFSILQGVALLVMLVSGFGLLGTLHLGFPHFAQAKLVLWAFLGVLPVILRRLRIPIAGGITIALVVIGVLAWLGVMKPALW